MRHLSWFLTLTWLLTTLCPTALAATNKQTASKRHSKSARNATFARDPYLGAIVLEAATGKVLFEDQADARGCPASLLKMMDLLLILEKVERRELSLRDPVPVSAKAAKAGVSKVWLSPGETFTVDEMLYALMVQSANDAAVALAEKVGGSTDGFVQLMNRRAKELGMTGTVFHSVHGLPPARGQEHDITTARDMSVLCRQLLKHADTLRYTSTRERPFRPNAGDKTVVMRTHNHLLGNVEGCDGLKTGYIAQAGFSIAVTAARGSRRIIVVVLDSVEAKTRDAKARELVTKGFSLLLTKR
jgi:serine-type D-Ala-D-Ala carboxypeptidase (penicillin-binding protein 5/6)